MGSPRATSIMDFVQRYRDYEQSRDKTHVMIKDLMIYAEHVESTMRDENGRLTMRLQTMSMDLEDATKSRRQLQNRLNEIEDHMGYVSLEDRNPFVSVLIDGNGLIFHQHYLQLGTEGGRLAASALHSTIATDPLIQANGAQILVKVVANLESLNRALKRDGAVATEHDLQEFVAGFNEASLFDFVDVGVDTDAYKKTAMLKLKETALFHLQNPTCKKIVLGVAHDPMYGPILDEIIRGDAATQERITVLEGCPTVRAVASIGVDITRFQDIFRSDKLTDRRTTSSHSVQSIQSASSISTSISERPNISYATVTQKASPPPQITLPIPLAPKPTSAAVRAVKQPPKQTWNPGPRGLDAHIPLNQTALDNIKKRKDNNKLCNNHFLRGPCAKGSECCFVHDYNPNKDEKNAIAFLARLNPCTNGQDCDVDNCIYGHHCPSVVNGICTHPFCKFRPDEHPPGTKLRTKA